MCQRDKIEQGQSNDCQRVPGAALDKAIGELLVSMINSQNIDIAIAVRHELQTRLDEADRLRHHQVERCRYEADLARQRYMKVDPDKRYVAEVLEAEWNGKLRALDEAQSAYDTASESDATTLDHDHTAALGALAHDFSTIWEDASLASRDRKRMVRLLIEDVTLLKNTKVTCHIRFKGGTCKTLNLPLPQSAWEQRKTDPELVSAIDKLLDEYPDYQLAEILRKRGETSGTGQPLSAARVTRIRIVYRLPNRWTRLRKEGKLSAPEIAARLGVSSEKVRRCHEFGLLTGHEYRKGNYLYDDPGTDVAERIPQLKRHAHLTAAHATQEVQYAT